MKKIEERPMFLRLKEDFWIFKENDLLEKYSEGYVLFQRIIGLNSDIIPFDFVDRLPDLFDEVGDHQIEINMVISCKDFISVDEVNNWFVNWVEQRGWTCNGAIKEFDE